MKESTIMKNFGLGIFLGTLLFFGIVSCCTATLMPTFDLKNQNGMPSYYYTSGDTVNITASVSSPDGDALLAYNWTFFDPEQNIILKNKKGTICSSDLPSELDISDYLITQFDYTFPSPLITYPYEYLVRLEVMGTESWPTVYTKEERITVDDYSDYIRANFSYSVDYENTKPNVTFFDLSEAQNVALINEWFWTLDGKKIGDDKSPVVSVPLDAGTYRANLSVRDKAGDIASVSKEVIVSVARGLTPVPTPTPEPLAARFIADRTTGQAPLQIQFIDQSTGSPVAWKWDFGDGATSTQRSPIHNYIRPGVYSVSLTVFDSSLAQSTSSLEKYITISRYS